MCGIIYTHLNNGNKIGKKVFRLYSNQKERGSQGFGFTTVNNKGLIGEVHKSDSEEGIKSLIKQVNDSNIVLFHHRKPTSTPNFIEAAHPLYISNDRLKSDWVVVHNGVISNAEALKTKFEALGYSYTTEFTKKLVSVKTGNSYEAGSMFNDSESFAIDIVEAIENGRTTIDSLGTIAFIAIKVNKETKQAEAIYYGRNMGNPLKLLSNNQGFFLTSAGDGEMIENNKLFSYDYRTGVETSTFLFIGSNVYTPPNYSNMSNVSNTAHTTPYKPNSAHSEGTGKVVEITGKEVKIQNNKSEIIDDFIYKTDITGSHRRRFSYKLQNDCLYKTDIPWDYAMDMTYIDFLDYTDLIDKIEDQIRLKGIAETMVNHFTERNNTSLILSETKNLNRITSLLKDLHLEIKELGKGIKETIDARNK